MKYKNNLNRHISLFAIIIIIICTSYMSINIFESSYSDRFFIPDFKEENIKVLQTLDFTNEDIDIINEFVSERNIQYLIDNNIDKKIAMSIITEKYYIDDYLENYYNYYINHNEQDLTKLVAIVNTHYSSEKVTNQEELTLINNYHFDISNFQVSNLIQVASEYHIKEKEFFLNKEVFISFIEMITRAKEENLSLKVSSAYIESTKDNALQSTKNKSCLAPSFDHQTGYAIDLTDSPNNTLSEEALIWLENNAYKHGFILRYPPNSQDITDFPESNVHYRYCGITCSTYIHENHITFDEYYEYFIKYNNPRHLT